MPPIASVINVSAIRRRCLFAVAAPISLLGASPLLAGQFSVIKTVDAVVDPSGYVAASNAPYGRSMNGNSFAAETITTFNGYQYSGYWRYVGGSGQLAVARRAVGSSTWESFTLGSSLVNGPNDAHNIVSLGINQIDGTIHLAYDMHGHTLRYRRSIVGAAGTDVAWNSSLFSAPETSQLQGGQSVVGVTYPMFIRTPTGELQLAFRVGGSGQGSWWIYDYSGATHAWSNGHQIDDGFIGVYTGTTSTNSASRNSYPNGFTYDANGLLHSSFVWRESATGAANHDINYVYSDDGGRTWRNNAAEVVGSQMLGMRFNLSSPGLIVRPMAENQTLMNQQGQAVDNSARFHAIMWHRDSAKPPTFNNVWEPQESSYFHYWRDGVGNWHQNRIHGNVGSRPKIFFDEQDNAIAIYAVVSGGAQLSGGSGSNLYFSEGDLVIAAATKATNWTDWKVIHTEPGPFVSEAQADARLMALDGRLSVIMQESPVGSLSQARAIRSLDYSIDLAAPSIRRFQSGSGNFAAGSNWSGGAAPGLNTVAIINGGRTAAVNSAAAEMDHLLIVGGEGSSGSLSIGVGGSLDLTQSGPFNTVYGGSIIVGRDGGAVGRYTQTAGSVSAWRFAVGDYFDETSGGGTSTANISGGTLTTYELNVAFSATGSSSGSSFNIVGGTVTVNGDVIIGEFGNEATVTLSGSGRLTIEGDLREGFNRVNTSNFRMNGGTLNMTSNFIAVDNFIYNGGVIQNVNTTSSRELAGISVGTLMVGRDQNATFTVPGNVRLQANRRVELWSGGSLSLGNGSSAVRIGQGGGTFTPGIVNVVPGGTLAGDGRVNAAVNNIGGTIAPGHSAGILTINGDFSQSPSGTLEIELGGTIVGSQYDRLAIAGSATLDGTLRVSLIGDFVPLPGQRFDVMTFGARTGDLVIANDTGLAGLSFVKTYSANTLSLTAAALLLGDANLDGRVDIRDLYALATHWQSSANWFGGDFDGSGLVDLADLNVLVSNWQAVTGAPPQPRSQPQSLEQALASLGLHGASVPEPAALGMMALLAGTVASGQRARRSR
ncbi:BNR-4 repeat-containing protein [Fontivita pretiosa]|uniref:BNR-4 repeat-containing protein n=1 Tax=Fontivita pretiosa TaxID=2989684 RepID=UPI003D1840E3